jgi:hypothetical protein
MCVTLAMCVEGLLSECELRHLDMRKVYAQRNILISQGMAKGEVAEFLRQKSRN